MEEGSSRSIASLRTLGISPASGRVCGGGTRHRGLEQRCESRRRGSRLFSENSSYAVGDNPHSSGIWKPMLTLFWPRHWWWDGRDLSATAGGGDGPPWEALGGGFGPRRCPLPWPASHPRV